MSIPIARVVKYMCEYCGYCVFSDSAQLIYMYSSLLPESWVKAYWEGGAWVEPDTTSKLLALPHFHIKGEKISTESILGQYPLCMLGEQSVHVLH